jgi:hypothetical protein
MELNRRVKILLKHMVENQNMPLTQKKKKKRKHWSLSMLEVESPSVPLPKCVKDPMFC